MSSDIAKAIASLGIWISIAIILAFGLFKMNFASDGSSLLLLALTALVVGTAAYATHAVWKPEKKDKKETPPAA